MHLAKLMKRAGFSTLRDEISLFPTSPIFFLFCTPQHVASSAADHHFRIPSLITVCNGSPPPQLGGSEGKFTVTVPIHCKSLRGTFKMSSA
ncbi:hypothetical protein CEXT_182401 [Caerostris extrusa]|uniref:Uncharacterized protein n=1 Tax=Caerostris extrusa TaxID=172846 RepID=A0AAV4MAT7_CAEEX|nr:hypothetical protein CEXT_182401 [Caerostris extrusa]